MQNNIALVGYTGFVGSNIAATSNIANLYNTSNIESSFNTSPDLLIYAGLRAEKYIANSYPDKDLELIKEAINNIKKINPSKLVLISTIDVYDDANNVNEDFLPNTEKLLPYGKNRLFLESWVEENFKEYCILRLPGLYGRNLKKNFIYDYINKIPFKLKNDKFIELCNINDSIKKYYKQSPDGYYQCNKLNKTEKQKLIDILRDVNFSALNFTDSRGVFQYYNLSELWKHINMCLDNNIKKINIATEPISINELYYTLTNDNFENICTDNIPMYNFKTKYSHLFDGENGYIHPKEYVLNDIKKFVQECQNNAM